MNKKDLARHLVENEGRCRLSGDHCKANRCPIASKCLSIDKLEWAKKQLNDESLQGHDMTPEEQAQHIINYGGSCRRTGQCTPERCIFYNDCVVGDPELIVKANKVLGIIDINQVVPEILQDTPYPARYTYEEEIHEEPIDCLNHAYQIKKLIEWEGECHAEWGCSECCIYRTLNDISSGECTRQTALKAVEYLMKDQDERGSCISIWR